MVSDRGTMFGLAFRTAYRRGYKPGSGRGVLFMNGWLGTRDFWFDPSLAVSTNGFPELLRSVTDDNYLLGMIDTLATWGNVAIQKDMTTLKTILRYGSKPGKVHLFGQSMGGLCALNWAKRHPSAVQSICLIIPTVEVQAIYDANRQGAQGAISGAYGGRPPDSFTPARTPSAFTRFPLRIYYSTNDPYTTQAETEAFGAAAEAELVNMGAIGHAEGSPFSGAAVGAFFAAHE